MADLDKKSLSERDICSKFITPASVASGWDVQMQVREEVTFTKGRVIVRGKMTARGEASRADCIRLAMGAPVIRPAIESFCATSVGNMGISATDLVTVPIPLPPLAGQRRIVAKVEELNAALSPMLLFEGNRMESARNVDSSAFAAPTGRRPNLTMEIPQQAAGDFSAFMAMLDTLAAMLTTARSTAEKLLVATVARLAVSPSNPLHAA